MKDTLYFNSTFNIIIGISVLLSTGCKEPIDGDAIPEPDPAFLKQEIYLEVDNINCLELSDIVSCEINSVQGSNSSLRRDSFNYAFSTSYRLLHRSHCFTRPLELRLTWSGPRPPDAFVYIVSNVDELLKTSSGHEFTVSISVPDSSNLYYYSHWNGYDNVRPEKLDDSAFSELSYSLTDTICNYESALTLIIDGSYSGYVYGGNNRFKDSLQVNFEAKELMVGNFYY